MKSFIGFFTYHNAVPIAISLVLLATGGVFAAANPQALYTKEQHVVSEDNTYIAQKDLATYSPKVEILGVTEDADNYYVAYVLSTIDVKDYVWQDVTKNETMKVPKSALGQYDDLGLYVTSQLKQIVRRQLSYLHEVQEGAKQNISQKVVATKYGGLIGKFLDNTTETIPGYIPVVSPPPPPPEPVVSVPPSTPPASVALPPAPTTVAPAPSLPVSTPTSALPLEATPPPPIPSLPIPTSTSTSTVATSTDTTSAAAPSTGTTSTAAISVAITSPATTSTVTTTASSTSSTTASSSPSSL